MDKNNLQRPQRAGARFYLTIKLKDYLSQSRRRGSEVVHGAASLFTISRTRVKGREQRREASCSAVLCWRDKAVSYGGRTFTRVWDRLWINPLHGQAGWEGMSLIILRDDCMLQTSHAAEGVVLVFCFGVCTRPPAFCLKTRNMELKATETWVMSVFTGRTVKLRHLCSTHASRLITAQTTRQIE